MKSLRSVFVFQAEKRKKAEIRRIRGKGWVVSNLMQPIAGNRGGERRRWYQEQVMHAGEQQWPGNKKCRRNSFCEIVLRKVGKWQQEQVMLAGEKPGGNNKCRRATGGNKKCSRRRSFCEIVLRKGGKWHQEQVMLAGKQVLPSSIYTGLSWKM